MCAQIGWNEANPADTESAGLGDDRIRSLMTSVRQGLSAEHTWPSAGGDAGIHLLGSARAYVGTQSRVSSSGTDGRLMWASDTSRLFHVGSGGTVYLGGPVGLSLAPGYITYPQRYHFVEEFNNGILNSSGSTYVTFPNSGYSGVPNVVGNYYYTVGTGTIDIFQVYNLSSTGFTVLSQFGSTGSGEQFMWRSIGSRAL